MERIRFRIPRVREMKARSLHPLTGLTLLGEAERTVEVLDLLYICTSMIVNEVKRLSLPFLATWVSSSTKVCS